MPKEGYCLNFNNFLNCFHSYRTKYRLEKHNNVCENHDYCYIEMLKEGNKVLKYKHGDKSMENPLTIFADLESLLERIDTCHNNPKKSSKTKTNKHTVSVYLLFTNCSFNATRNKLYFYRLYEKPLY